MWIPDTGFRSTYTVWATQDLISMFVLLVVAHATMLLRKRSTQPTTELLGLNTHVPTRLGLSFFLGFLCLALAPSSECGISHAYSPLRFAFLYSILVIAILLG